MKFYPRDWRGDQALRVCSPAARGVWMDLLCVMHEADPEGCLLINGLPVTEAQLCSLTGTSANQLSEIIDELERAGVFSRRRDGVVYSRRMTRDSKRAKAASKEGAKGGNPNLKGGHDKPGYVYLIGVRSDGRYKLGCSVNPKNRLKKIRAEYPGDNLKIIAQWMTDDMGSLQRTLERSLCESPEKSPVRGWVPLSLQDVEIAYQIADPKGSTKGWGKGDPYPQRPEARVQKESGSGVEHRSLSPGGPDPPTTQPDPKKFPMVKDWKMDGDVASRIEAMFMPELGIDPFWRQVERFIAHHCNAGTMDTQQGFSRSLENWFHRANANRENDGGNRRADGSGASGSGHEDIAPSMSLETFVDHTLKLFEQRIRSLEMDRMTTLELAKFKSEAGDVKLGKSDAVGLERVEIWTREDLLCRLGLKTEAA